MSTNSATPNILLCIADDLGEANVTIAGSGATRTIEVHNVDNSGTDIVGAMPNTSLLLRNGLYFSGAWAQPACSPTRASIYTGLHPWKHGVGSPMGNPVLDSGAGFTSLPNLLPGSYVSGLFGKWHLGGVSDAATPTDHGWDRHIGTLGGVLPDYYVWSVVDSATGYTQVALDANVDVTQYATLRTARDAAEWINANAADPWFATIAFNTPHDPFHVPPGGYDAATAGNPADDDYLFNLMVQNMDGNIGRLIGTSGQPGGRRYFPPIAADQLSNTIIVFIGDNGTPAGISLEEHKTEIYEGGVRVPMIITDGQALMNEINGQAISPRFLHASRVNATASQMIHVTDLYATIVRLADPAANAFPSDMDAKDFSGVVKNPIVVRPPIKPPVIRPGGIPTPPPVIVPPILNIVRVFNFSQWYTNSGNRATIRNAAYKLNFDESMNPQYSLYQYVSGEIPDLEYPNIVDASVDVFNDALNGSNADAQTNLDLLLDELIANYQQDETTPFPDPR
ncbi:MAG: sulfatase-like hydrolase/transferase [Zoogloeaceae bacterium]|nr:sulfatase-like hydrolase/transferase [Zoogloeaceae bacterium]MCP5239267.1 sulfatase-like hydrolase/transferase [Zoogloeaceae bacterium]MCP5255853.1 sulfatase-like hydrolase/transferase [Zoogloeaceae bacterium]